MKRDADAEAARSALATEVKEALRARSRQELRELRELRELQQRAALKHKHASLREAELRSRQEALWPCGSPVEALWPSSSFFGNGSSTVRSREKFEMQLKLTQELERVILQKTTRLCGSRTLGRAATADGYGLA